LKKFNFLYRLIYQHGILENTFEAEQFLNLKGACLYALQQIDVNILKSITIIKVSKLYSDSSTIRHTCNSRSRCATKICPYKEKHVFLLYNVTQKRTDAHSNPKLISNLYAIS